MTRGTFATAALMWVAACGGGDGATHDASAADGTIPTFPSCADPDWLQDLVTEFESREPGNPPYSVTQYSYEGMPVFYLPAQCCDQLSTLLDRCGELVCAPDGGFSGDGDGRCTDFHAVATDETPIWQDPRGTGE